MPADPLPTGVESVPTNPTNVVQVGSQSVRLVAVPVGKSPFGEMLQSKKFLAMVVGMLFTLLGKVGLNVDAATQEQVLNLVMVYIGAQGVADAGQGFARVRNNPAPPNPTAT